jgi:hypothetical protein
MKLLQDCTSEELLDELKGRFDEPVIFAAMKRGEAVLFMEGSAADRAVLWQKVDAAINRELREEAGLGADFKVP